jgi:hypothetical protein
MSIRITGRSVNSIAHLGKSDIEAVIILTDSWQDLTDIASHFVEHLLPRVTEDESVRVIAERASVERQADADYLESILEDSGLGRSGMVRCEFMDVKEEGTDTESRVVVILRA